MIQLKGKILVREVLDFEDRFSHIEFLSLDMTIAEVYEALYRSLDLEPNSSQSSANPHF